MEVGWRLVGKVTRNDMRGKDPVHKLHTKLKKLVPRAEEIAEFGMSEEAIEYLQEQLADIAKKRGFSSQAIKEAVDIAMLQFAPCTIEGVSGFQVYYREAIK